MLAGPRELHGNNIGEEFCAQNTFFGAVEALAVV